MDRQMGCLSLGEFPSDCPVFRKILHGYCFLRPKPEPKPLAADGMLVKRPLIVGDDVVLVGFKEKEWEQALQTS